ncbi:hypothetical protein FOS14_22080 [Skermania sp. ID1734]|uniref:hypothetical protein n=1 Tax=Skermania sp. ID1734 TaxID=2597516 RepID=UPI00117DF17F|nr:hypothetical protein [Skermania sp. ID1734]TSD93755.1 hypothetical protein FOS14_22080 [Skermania sp. ID1734]
MTDPADLDQQAWDARDQLQQVRRAVVELTRDYARLDPSIVDVDELGEPADAAAVVESVRAGLLDLTNALTMADDAFDVVTRYGSRLKRRNT